MRTFDIPGKPAGKGRPRVTTIGGHARQYSPAKTASYESKAAYCYRAAHPNAEPYPANVALEVNITAVFAIPASWPKKRKAAAMWHTGKPDCDNVAKICCDALNGIAWHDDAQVARISVNKRYGAECTGEYTVVTISELT